MVVLKEEEIRNKLVEMMIEILGLSGEERLINTIAFLNILRYFLISKKKEFLISIIVSLNILFIND